MSDDFGPIILLLHIRIEEGGSNPATLLHRFLFNILIMGNAGNI